MMRIIPRRARGEKYNIYRHARMISGYIHARQVELRATGTAFAQTNRFELRAASLVNSNDPAVAYYGNGIAPGRRTGSSALKAVQVAGIFLQRLKLAPPPVFVEARMGDEDSVFLGQTRGEFREEFRIGRPLLEIVDT